MTARATVLDSFLDFSTEFEGSVAWPYLDILGLVTVGIGNLIDAGVSSSDRFAPALGLPWVKPDGSSASPDEIRDQLKRLASELWVARSGYQVAARFTDIRLTNEGIKRVVLAKFDANWAILLRRFPDLESWPADAQLGLASAAWAAGPAWAAPRFDAFCRAQDFHGASREVYLNDTHNPGLRPRNAANKLLFENAFMVVSADIDRDVLYYPSQVLPEVEA